MSHLHDLTVGTIFFKFYCVDLLLVTWQHLILEDQEVLQFYLLNLMLNVVHLSSQVSALVLLVSPFWLILELLVVLFL